MKKVLLIIDSLGSGGAQNQITILAVGLKKVGYNVLILVYYPNAFYESRITEAGIPLIYVQKKDKLGIGLLYKLRSVIRKCNTEVIISFLNTPNFYAAFAKKYFNSKLLLITSQRSSTDFSKLSKLHLTIREWVNSTSDFIVANSYHERDRWERKYPSLKSKFRTIYNAVDHARFKLNPSAKQEDSLLVVGSVSPAKNGLLIIEALNSLHKEGQKVQLLWIGKKVYTIKHRKEYIQRMEKLINSYGLSDYWAWKEPTTEIESFYQSYKVLILASVVEGLPNVVCEAQSCGLPCLVSNVLDHPLLIADRIQGFLFDPQDADSLTSAIKEYLALSDQKVNQMRQEALVSSRDKFSEDKFISSYVELIES